MKSWYDGFEFWWEYGAYSVKDTPEGTELELIVTGTLPPMSLDSAREIIARSCSLFPDVAYIILNKCVDNGPDTATVEAYSKWRGNPWKENKKKRAERRFKGC